MDLIFSTPASTSLPPTSASGPVSLQVRCLQVVAADLENFPVVSLASLSKRIRVKLLVLLPPADVCKLEKTPVFYDIEEDEVWRTIYYENKNGKRHSDSLSAKQLFLSNLLPLIHLSKSTKNRCQNTATIFTLLFQGRGGKVPPRYTHHFQQSTPDKKGEKEVGKRVPSHDTHHAPHEGSDNYSDVHLLGLITDTTQCYPKELYVDCGMFSQLFTPDSYTLLCQYLSHVTHVVLAWNISKVDLLDVPRSVFDLLSPALPLVSLSLCGTVELLRVAIPNVTTLLKERGDFAHISSLYISFGLGIVSTAWEWPSQYRGLKYGGFEGAHLLTESVADMLDCLHSLRTVELFFYASLTLHENYRHGKFKKALCFIASRPNLLSLKLTSVPHSLLNDSSVNSILEAFITTPANNSQHLSIEMDSYDLSSKGKQYASCATPESNALYKNLTIKVVNYESLVWLMRDLKLCLNSLRIIGESVLTEKPLLIPLDMIRKYNFDVKSFSLESCMLPLGLSPGCLDEILSSCSLRRLQLAYIADSSGPDLLTDLVSGLQKQRAVGSLEVLSLPRDNFGQQPCESLKSLFEAIFSLPHLEELNIVGNGFRAEHMELIHACWKKVCRDRCLEKLVVYEWPLPSTDKLEETALELLVSTKFGIDFD